MKYVQVCKALYDYEARTEDELSIKQDNVLYVIEKEDNDWWKTELKQSIGEEQGPIGLVPADYLEEVTPIGKVRAEYDYEAQQEEELSFEEGAEMELLEQDDPDWYLVKLVVNGEIGLAPSNYVEAIEGAESVVAAVEEVAEEAVVVEEEGAHIATPSQPTAESTPITREPIVDDAQSWNVHEYDASKKKKKKGKGSLFIGNGMICYGSETDKASPVQQYPILDVTKYLFDGKNLHIEIGGNKPSILDLQASSKSEAKAILVKISDSTRAAQQSATHLNLQQKQMAAPATPIMITSIPPPPSPPLAIQQQSHLEEQEEESNCVPKWGISIYSFQAEGGDELSVEENEQIYVLDYERTDGWWRIQKVDGQVGLVPCSYVQFDDNEDEDDNLPVGVGSVGLAATATATARSDNVQEIRRKRQEEEDILQQKRIAEQKARKEEESRRRREQEEEGERLKQVQEAAKRAELTRQKQIEQDYKRKENERKENERKENERKENERKTVLARTASASKASRHQDLPKPDTSKIRTWTDRSGSFRVEAQFIDFHNGKLRLHKLNGVKIDVPVEKMCAKDVDWVENYTKSPPSTPVAPLPPQQQPLQSLQQQPLQQQPTKSTLKKLNQRWDWFDWFMIIGIPMQASLQYASSFKAEKLDDSDIHNLTHKQMKILGIKEEHVQRIERYIETGKPEQDNIRDEIKQSQIEKDEELARKLQSEWESGSNNSTRPKPTVSAPKDIHPDLLDFIGTQLTSDSNKQTISAVGGAGGNLVGFNDDAWAPRAATDSSMSPIKAIAATAVPTGPTPTVLTGPTPEQIKAAEAERKRIAEEEQIQKIQLMSLQRQAQEQQKQLEQLQQLTKQQLELQKQLAMQTGTQQHQHQQQLQMQQVQVQQQQLQQQLAQQPTQLQPSFALQSVAITGATPPSRQRPIANNRLSSDPSLGQWQPTTQPTGFQQHLPTQPTGFQQQQQQQPVQTGFHQQQPQQQQPSWQAQQLQPQMTGFPASNQPIGSYQQQQPMATATVPLSSILPQPLIPSTPGQQQQTIGVQATGGRHWGSATPANPFGSPVLSPLQAQMTGVQFSTPSPQAFHQSPLQGGYNMPGFQQPQSTGAAPTNSIFTPQGSMQYGQSAFPNNQRPW